MKTLSCDESEVSGATLYVVATPIGNVRDITLRAIAVLSSVDVIAAEDTRVTKGLLTKINVSNRLISYRAHNERTSSNGILKLLSEGRSVALVSDAGTPGICDPGEIVVSQARDAGFAVVPIPGPSALSALLSVSNVSSKQFVFLGFVPPKITDRQTLFREILGSSGPFVMFEVPHRIKGCLKDLADVFGDDGELLIAREISKINEEIVSMNCNEALSWVESNSYKSKGEFVMMLNVVVNGRDNQAISAESLALLEELLGVMSLRQAVDTVARYSRENKKLVYKNALKLKDNAEK